MALATAELYWLRMLFKELAIGMFHIPTIWCDNIGAIALTSNPVFHARTKHVEVDYHFIREKVCNNDIKIQHVSTSECLHQRPNCTTFLVSQRQINGLSKPHNSRGCLRKSRSNCYVKSSFHLFCYKFK
jgi:hypothetical protein